jgi:hypothetical protein
MLSSFLRSSAAVVVLGLLGLGIDFGLRQGMRALAFLGVEKAALFGPYMPGNGLNCWNVEESMFTWQPFAAVVLWTFIALAITRHRFQRMDVP